MIVGALVLTGLACSSTPNPPAAVTPAVTSVTIVHDGVPALPLGIPAVPRLCDGPGFQVASFDPSRDQIRLSLKAPPSPSHLELVVDGQALEQLDPGEPFTNAATGEDHAAFEVTDNSTSTTAATSWQVTVNPVRAPPFVLRLRDVTQSSTSGTSAPLVLYFGHTLLGNVTCTQPAFDDREVPGGWIAYTKEPGAADISSDAVWAMWGDPSWGDPSPADPPQGDPQPRRVSGIGSEFGAISPPGADGTGVTLAYEAPQRFVGIYLEPIEDTVVAGQDKPSVSTAAQTAWLSTGGFLYRKTAPDAANGMNDIFRNDGTQLTQSGADAFPTPTFDDSQIAFVRDGRLFVLNPTPHSITSTTGGLQVDESPTFSPDGKKVAFIRAQLSQPYMPPQPGQAIELVPGHLCIVDVTGANETCPLHKFQTAAHPSWSPEGSQLVVDSGPSATDRQIYSYSLTTHTWTQLTTNGINTEPVWCPEGTGSHPATPTYTSILYVSGTGANREIYRMAPDGSNPTNLTNDSVAEFDPTCR